MTRPNPANAVTDEESGQRWYVIPDGQGGERRLLSVTTAFGVIAKMGLDIWMCEFTAGVAFEELPTIITASRIKPCGRTYHRCDNHDWRDCPDRGCDTCRACVAVWIAKQHKVFSKARADQGTRVHDVIEWWSLHGEIRPHDPDIAPYVEAFRAFTVEYGLVPESFVFCEATCVNPDDNYAGTTDGALRIEAAASPAAAKLVARVLRAAGEYGHLKTSDAIRRAVIRDKRSVTLLVDWKTREKPEPRFYPEHALQLAGYQRAKTLRLKGSDTDVPMPTVDGAMIVQLRPDGATPRLVLTDDDTFEAFLCALKLFLWRAEKGARAVGAHTFPLGRRDGDVPEDEPEGAPAPQVNHEPASDAEPAYLTTEPDPFALVGAATGGLSDSDIPF